MSFFLKAIFFVSCREIPFCKEAGVTTYHYHRTRRSRSAGLDISQSSWSNHCCHLRGLQPPSERRNNWLLWTQKKPEARRQRSHRDRSRGAIFLGKFVVKPLSFQIWRCQWYLWLEYKMTTLPWEVYGSPGTGVMGDGLASTQVHSWLLLALLKKSTEPFPRQGREKVYFKYMMSISF